MEEGTKYDGGKPRIGEMLQDFAEPLYEVTKAWEYGAQKYEERNWRKVDDGERRYTNALLRHLLAEETAPVDDESHLLHATHVAWNALARLWFILQERQLRYVVPKEAFDIDGFNNAMLYPVREKLFSVLNKGELIVDDISERCAKMITDYFKDKKIERLD